MKPHVFAIVAASIMISCFTASAARAKAAGQNAEKQDFHVLTSLWAQYDQAYKKDQPKDQLKILEQIKKEAGGKRLPWDFYDAVKRCEQVAVQINWKERESRRTAARKEIADFDEPVVSFFDNYDERKAIFTSQSERLAKAYNPAFYHEDWRLTLPVYGKALIENLQNDLEYAAWSLFLNRQLDSAEVSNTAGTRYPLRQLIEFQCVTNDETGVFRAPAVSADKLQAFARKYNDKAVSLLARQALLSQRFGQLEEKDASSAEYLTLKADCEQFEKDRNTFAKTEKTLAECCTQVKQLLETLDSKEISFSIKDGFLEAHLRNLDKVTVKVTKDKKTLFTKTLSNTTESFYRTDTLRMALPDLDDDTYNVECVNGKCTSEAIWYKYTLSAAYKTDRNGYWAWATDYITGEPVKGYENGPLAITPNKEKQLQVSITENGHIRRSGYGWTENTNFAPDAIKPELRALLLTDRSAFQPEETVHFKVIVYTEAENLTISKGKTLIATLHDAQGEEISRKTLTTSEFGSADGNFFLPRRERNGYYEIRIETNGKYLTSKSIRVDDFVLPTFALTFDRIEQPIYSGETARVFGTIKAYSGHSLAGADIKATISRWGDTIEERKLELDGQGHFCLEFQTDSTQNYNYYNIEITVVDGTGETKQFSQYVHTQPRPTKEEKPRTYYFEDLGDETSAVLKVVTGTRKVWALVEVYGPYAQLIESRVEVIEAGSEAKPGEKTFRRELLPSDPDEIALSVTYFHDGRSEHDEAICRRRDTSLDLPLEFTRFLDATAPGAQYTFTVKTAPGVECAATIFDKSSETILPNHWGNVRITRYLKPSPYYQMRPGTNNAGGRIRAFGYTMKSANMMLASAACVEMDDAVEEEAFADAEAPMVQDAGADIPIREDFSTTIAWEPCLHSDKDGNIAFSFRNADKLSTFIVQLFAHDKDMRNETIRKEMVVTLPVKIAVVEPQFLYDNDTYSARITLSSAVDRTICGSLSVNGRSKRVEVGAYSQATTILPVEIAEGATELELTAVFRPDEGSDCADGIRVRVPVRKPEQTLTEAHSAVLFAGADRDELIRQLRAEFTLIPGESAELREISILDMVREAVPQEFEIGSDNSISLMKTLYASSLAVRLGSAGLTSQQLAALTEKLLACRKSDGGFAWFAEMNSSPIVTVVILDWIGSMRGRGLPIPEVLSEAIPAAVQYLDRSFFGKSDRPWWCGRISLDQYLYVRAQFAGEPFGQKVDRKTASSVRSLLVPSGNLGLQGAVFAKARRLLTLKALASSDEGLALARKLGIKLFASSRIRKTIESDTRSLTQYAVSHQRGGIYYPNAVMSWRGLLESELYAHSLLCQLMAEQGEKSIAEGIRLWLMLQKETQEWRNCPATVNALACVLDGSAETLNTRVIALSGTTTMPFEKVAATGNGFTISCKYYLEEEVKGGPASRTELHEGDMLPVGTRVVAVYSIWNEENRSFVRIQAPRPACLRPVQQLSGYYRGAYRSVSVGASTFWFETYPEEKTTLEESFYVSQSGLFHCAAPEIESLYAPHYRANGPASPTFLCE